MLNPVENISERIGANLAPAAAGDVGPAN